MKKSVSLSVVLLILVVLLASCGATPEPEVIVQTVEVEKEVTVIETVEVEKEVTVIETVEVEKEVTVIETVEVEKELSLVDKVLVSEMEGGTVIEDPARMPSTFGEAPMLAEKVAAGELPPVEERLPKEPLVLEPLDEIGEYGGNFVTGGLGTYSGSSEILNRPSGMDKLIFWDATGSFHVPSVAKGWEQSDDYRTLTFFLREGMRWSDGEPFTAEDIRFWWEDVYMNKELVPTTDAKLQTNGVDATFEVVDDYTVRWTFQDPYPTITNVFAESYSAVSRGIPLAFWLPGGPYHPKHYMQQFHADYADAAELDKLIEETGVDNWVTLYTHKLEWHNNVDMPTLSPWMTTQAANTGLWTLERNPYFWEVDTEGNQLPYLDSWVVRLSESPDIIVMRAAAGEFDYQWRRLEVHNLPVLAQFAEEGDYSIYVDPASQGMSMGVAFRQTFVGDDEQAKWNKVTDFRRAICLGIDRAQFNEAFFFGLGIEGSPMPREGSLENPGEAEWRTKWHTYDPDKANEMLDSIGLDQKDSEGFRLRTDGSGDRLVFELPLDEVYHSPEALEMFAQQMEDIGISVAIQPRGSQILDDQRDTDEISWYWASNWGAERIFAGTDAPRQVFPAAADATDHGQAIADWFQSGGTEGTKPDWSPELLEMLDLYGTGLTATLDEQTEIAKEIWKISVDEVMSCGIVGGFALWPVRVTSNELGNVPDGICKDFHCRYPGLGRLETWWHTNPARRTAE